MQISAKNQKQGRVASVIHGSSYSQVAVEQTDADGVATGSFIHAAIPVDICKKNGTNKRKYSYMYFSCSYSYNSQARLK